MVIEFYAQLDGDDGGEEFEEVDGCSKLEFLRDVESPGCPVGSEAADAPFTSVGMSDS